jgi:peptidyl-prolyl cis-trans isomerase C
VKRLLPLLLLLPLLAACASTAGGQAVVPARDDSPVVARVLGRPVTLADFERRLQQDIGPGVADLVAQGQTREQIEQLANDSQVRGRVFDQMVQDFLLLDYARRNGIGVDAAAVDASVTAPQGDPGAPALADQRLTTARQQLAYEVIARNTRADMFHARHILVADEAAADQALADLAAGADFAALARERSTDTTSAEAGGDLGWTPRGDFAPEFEEAAFTLPLGQPGKVQSQFGWHVIEVLERQEQRPFDNFEQLRRSANAQTFFEQSFTPWYEELRRQAEASGDVEIAQGFDPNSVPLPFPADAP